MSSVPESRSMNNQKVLRRLRSCAEYKKVGGLGTWKDSNLGCESGVAFPPGCLRDEASEMTLLLHVISNDGSSQDPVKLYSALM